MTRRIVHVIVGLEAGGAEGMMRRLISSHSDSALFEHHVVSLTGTGAVGHDLAAVGVPVHQLGLRGAFDAIGAFVRLVSILKRVRPDIVQTWMYHADLFGGLAARIAGAKSVFWGLRCSANRSGKRHRSRLASWIASRPVVMFGALLSYFVPDRIVCCAVAARASHADVGYDVTKMTLIVNGYEPSRFELSSEARTAARTLLGIAPDRVVIGICGRFNELKGYQYFVEAAAKVAAAHPEALFVMLGRGVNAENAELDRWISQSGYGAQFSLLGERRDVERCLAAMDIFCSASISEGFPNVICEAMSAGLPCVVTDAGDAAEIVGPLGIVVPIRDAPRLAHGIEGMIAMGAEERRRLGVLGRSRIRETFSMETARGRFEALYSSVTN